MTCFVGIDGGGSNLRIVIKHKNQTKHTEYASANPNTLGYARARDHIRQSLEHALQNMSPDAIAIGIAGASSEHSASWLIETLNTFATDHTIIVPTSDIEIALIGAHERPHGALLLAGTGSIAYAIDEHNQRHRVGGWGYLIGDEGSGYWIGRQALHHLTRQFDNRTARTDFHRHIVQMLDLTTPYDLINWVYRQQSQPPTSAIARLAPTVIHHAELGDTIAVAIIDEAIQHLTELARAVCHRAQMNLNQLAFAGGLTNHTFIRNRLMDALTLTHDPTPRQSPAIGALILAQMTYERRISPTTRAE